MKPYNANRLSFKERHYSQLPASIKSFCREQLQSSLLSILFDLQVTIPSSSPSRSPRIFNSSSSQKTTLGRFFLKRINDPQTSYEYIERIYNSIVFNKNPAQLFKGFDDETVAICDAAYERYNELRNNSPKSASLAPLR